MKHVVMDTGPIVAMMNPKDDRHAECLAFFDQSTSEWILPITVLAEVCGMLAKHPDLEADFLDTVAHGAFAVESLTKDDTQRIAELARKYIDFPLGGVDASVLAIAERLGIVDVATIDHRHFRAVRPRHVAALTLWP